MSSEIDVFISNYTLVDPEIYQLWIDGLSAADAVKSLNQSGLGLSTGAPLELIASDVLDHYRTYSLLEKLLSNPNKLQEQSAFQIEPQTRRLLIERYYNFDDIVMRELLGKKLTSKHRKDLDEVADKTKVLLKSCRLNFKMFTSERDAFILMVHFRSGTRNEDGTWTRSHCSLVLLSNMWKIFHIKHFLAITIVLCNVLKIIIAFARGKSTGRPTVLSVDVVDDIKHPNGAKSHEISTQVICWGQVSLMGAAEENMHLYKVSFTAGFIMKLKLLETSSSSSSDDEVEIVVRRPKLYRTRINCFIKYNETEFFERFRLTKETVAALLDRIEHLIALPTNRGSIPAMCQLLLALRFYATGSMLISAGDFVGVSKASACRIVKRVTTEICSLLPEYIYMPRNHAEMGNSAEKFYNIARFPRAIGAIDCTLIRIQSPGGNDGEIFRSRKGFFALNVQTVSDANLKIRNIIVRWPGSCHDQTIFNNSNLKQEFVAGRYGRYLLLGDSGYRIEPYLMTPLLQTQTAAENLYNESQIRSRNVVERQYGLWKRRFPVLSLGIKLHLQSVMNVIVATAVLHNIAIDMNEDIPEDWLNVGNQELDNIEAVGNNENGGQGVRRLLITEHFANL